MFKTHLCQRPTPIKRRRTTCINQGTSQAPETYSSKATQLHSLTELVRSTEKPWHTTNIRAGTINLHPRCDVWWVSKHCILLCMLMHKMFRCKGAKCIKCSLVVWSKVITCLLQTVWQVIDACDDGWWQKRDLRGVDIGPWTAVTNCSEKKVKKRLRDLSGTVANWQRCSRSQAVLHLHADCGKFQSCVSNYLTHRFRALGALQDNEGSKG